MKQFVLFLALTMFSIDQLQAQGAKADSLEKSAKKDSSRLERFFARATYPLIRNSKMSGVMPVEGVQEKPDPSLEYKLLIELTVWSKDSSSVKEVNEGLAEVGRLINLHVAAGIPKEHIHVAIVVHGPAMNIFLDNAHYHRKFKTDNPNLDILTQFLNLGTKLIACGQAEIYFNIPKEDMIPEVSTALSAMVILSSYQTKGYILYHADEEK